MDDPVLILRSQRDLLFEQLCILRAIARPLSLFLLPAAGVMMLLDSCFGNAAIPVGRPAVVTVQFANAASSNLPQLRLTAPPEIEVTSGAVRILSEGQISWRILPVRSCNCRLFFEDDAGSIGKRIATGPGVRFISERRVRWSWKFFGYWRELPFQNASIAWIGIDYPRALLLGRSWIVWFLTFSLIGTLFGLFF